MKVNNVFELRVNKSEMKLPIILLIGTSGRLIIHQNAFTFMGSQVYKNTLISLDENFKDNLHH